MNTVTITHKQAELILDATIRTGAVDEAIDVKCNWITIDTDGIWVFANRPSFNSTGTGTWQDNNTNLNYSLYVSDNDAELISHAASTLIFNMLGVSKNDLVFSAVSEVYGGIWEQCILRVL